MRELEIQQLLTQIRSLLERYQVKFWADQIADLEEQFKKAYASGNDRAKRRALDQLEELYGGMGSFNDLFISSTSGDAISPEDESAVNKQLSHLRRQLYQVLQAERASLR